MWPFTHDNFLYLQFICCMFCSDLWETLNIIRSIFDGGKESAKKSKKGKINKALLKIVFKQNFLKTFQKNFSLKLLFLLKVFSFLRNHEIENIQKQPFADVLEKNCPWKFGKICRHSGYLLQHVLESSYFWINVRKQLPQDNL